MSFKWKHSPNSSHKRLQYCAMKYSNNTATNRVNSAWITLFAVKQRAVFVFAFPVQYQDDISTIGDIYWQVPFYRCIDAPANVTTGRIIGRNLPLVSPHTMPPCTGAALTCLLPPPQSYSSLHYQCVKSNIFNGKIHKHSINGAKHPPIISAKPINVSFPFLHVPREM